MLLCTAGSYLGEQAGTLWNWLPQAVVDNEHQLCAEPGMAPWQPQCHTEDLRDAQGWSAGSARPSASVSVMLPLATAGETTPS